MEQPKTRQEKKGKGSKHKDPYNQKSIRIQERLREQIASTSSPQTSANSVFRQTQRTK